MATVFKKEVKKRTLTTRFIDVDLYQSHYGRFSERAVMELYCVAKGFAIEDRREHTFQKALKFLRNKKEQEDRIKNK